MLVDFLEREGLYLMNSFFEKQPQRKWTWASPDGRTKNEIDFIMTDKRHIFRDVSVINRFKTGSDHRLLRGTLNINFKLERRRLVKSTLRPTLNQIRAGNTSFQRELQSRFESLETTTDIDADTIQIVKPLREVGHRHFSIRSKSKESKLSSETLELMRQRREFPSAGDTSSELRVLNKRIKKLIRRDLRRSNTRAIEAAIEQNRGSKVFVQQLGRSHLTKLRSADGNIVASKPEVLAEIEGFYGQLYASHAQKSVAQLTDSRAPLIRHYTDDIPTST
ncbi:uncharacterized protein LOC125490255 [Plutella xylostella]|uniref:uncharacterized protein LOC125490255 n=1 Tax=Plutella xylostella TaxID=51655 RepID=UPI00203250A8|nr:uncharacterized protein LOC125490255 [Plutella xylostella]